MDFSREQLSRMLREYFAANKLEIDWDAVARLDDLALCNLLTGALPWEAAERQTLIEAVTLNERVEKLVGLLQFAISPALPGSVKKH
jgi:Lon protease-like protein